MPPSNTGSGVNLFRAIIVGAGPAGLTAAHALDLAGIDFLVLEARPRILEDRGASLVIWPHTFRVLHQLGLLEAVMDVATLLNHHKSFTAQGYVFNSTSTRYCHMQQNHGARTAVVHRADLINVMHAGLTASAKTKILVGKKLVDIEVGEAGVVVSCSDGSTYRGTIIIGADGVHSKTRRLMREIALRDCPSQPWDAERPYISTYQLLYGSFPTPRNSPSATSHDVQAKDKAIMYFSSPERAWFFLYKKLPLPITERIDYSDANMQALVDEFAEFPLTESIKVKDVWPTMLGYGLTNLEEGLVQHWSFGRIVLVGDACHKATTHVGLGFNNAIQDVVVLCNMLVAAIRTAPGGVVETPMLGRVFGEYHSHRIGPGSSLIDDLALARTETRMHTWANAVYYAVSRYLTVPSFIESLIVNFIIAPGVRKGRVLDYVPKVEPIRGKLSWLYPMPAMPAND